MSEEDQSAAFAFPPGGLGHFWREART
jgi:hypothetical protein